MSVSGNVLKKKIRVGRLEKYFILFFHFILKWCKKCKNVGLICHTVRACPAIPPLFLTIFSTILCSIIVHLPNKHHMKVSTRLSKYIIVVTFHVNKWHHRRDRILSGFARHAAGCCLHNSAYLKERNLLCVKMKQVGYFSSESFYFILIYKRNTKNRYLSI